MPRGREAIIDRRKLVDYVLSPMHPRGRHKARVFASVLGLGAGEAAVLEAALRQAALSSEAVSTGVDIYGARYQIDFVFRFRGRSAIITSAWLCPADAGPPRFLTAFVKH